jgi:hypothetical protein
MLLVIRVMQMMDDLLMMDELLATASRTLGTNQRSNVVVLVHNIIIQSTQIELGNLTKKNSSHSTCT